AGRTRSESATPSTTSCGCSARSSTTPTTYITDNHHNTKENHCEQRCTSHTDRQPDQGTRAALHPGRQGGLQLRHSSQPPLPGQRRVAGKGVVLQRHHLGHRRRELRRLARQG